MLPGGGGEREGGEAGRGGGLEDGADVPEAAGVEGAAGVEAAGGCSGTQPTGAQVGGPEQPVLGRQLLLEHPDPLPGGGQLLTQRVRLIAIQQGLPQLSHSAQRRSPLQGSHIGGVTQGVRWLAPVLIFVGIVVPVLPDRRRPQPAVAGGHEVVVVIVPPSRNLHVHPGQHLRGWRIRHDVLPQAVPSQHLVQGHPHVGVGGQQSVHALPQLRRPSLRHRGVLPLADPQG
mmetsp:Transcript_75747/g.202671  ORF Transcript_75747/g.202671 Transcript_75747/m.202671 type:complete len:230 (-) Transcript_75747:611-1300(-)